MAVTKDKVKKPAIKKAVAKKPATKSVATKKSEIKKVATNASAKPAVKKAVAKKSTISVTLVKSFHGRLPSHRATVKGLGLKRINHTVALVDTPEVRGMIDKVSYLIKVRG